MEKKFPESGRLSNLYIQIGLFPWKSGSLLQNQEELAALLNTIFFPAWTSNWGNLGFALIHEVSVSAASTAICTCIIYTGFRASTHNETTM